MSYLQTIPPETLITLIIIILAVMLILTSLLDN